MLSKGRRFIEPVKDPCFSCKWLNGPILRGSNPKKRGQASSNCLTFCSSTLSLGPPGSLKILQAPEECECQGGPCRTMLTNSFLSKKCFEEEVYMP